MHPFGWVNGLSSESSVHGDSWEQEPSHSTALIVKYFKYQNPLMLSFLKNIKTSFDNPLSRNSHLDVTRFAIGSYLPPSPVFNRSWLKFFSWGGWERLGGGTWRRVQGWAEKGGNALWKSRGAESGSLCPKDSPASSNLFKSYYEIF